MNKLFVITTVVVASVCAPCAAFSQDAVASESGAAYFAKSCPTADAKAVRAGGLLIDILGGVLKQVFTKAADAFTDIAKKQNAKLNGTTEFYNVQSLYDVAGGKLAHPAGCLILVRFPTDTTNYPKFEKRVAGQEVALKALDPKFAVRDPVFYAEFELVPIVGKLASGDDAAIGFRMTPNYVFFGDTAAKAWGGKASKAVRAEIELRKLGDAGLPDKATYSASFNLGQFSKDAERYEFVTAFGPPLLFPAPRDMKSAVAFKSTDGSLSSGVVDTVPVQISAKLLEAEDPNILMQAIEKTLASKKGDLEKQASSIADKIVVAVVGQESK